MLILIRLGGLLLVFVALGPALAWSPEERARLRWPWLPLVEAVGILATGLAVAALGTFLPQLH